MRKIFLFLAILLCSCRKDMEVLTSSKQWCYDYQSVGEIKGFFLLNQGNMGSNKASLDYFSYTTGYYHKNIFAERNPNVVFELGDVGNDLKIYGDKLYAVINNSSLIVVMDVSTAIEVGSIAIPSCRYIEFKDDYGYVSSYDDKIYKINLESLSIEATCKVGLNPEQISIVGDKLYVANSYANGIYDNTISVIDLTTFTLKSNITVADNLYSLKVDQNNMLWASTWGDHENIPSATHLINTTSDTLEQSFEIENQRMSYCNNMLYILNDSGNLTINTNSKAIENNFIIDNSYSNIQTPYALALNPETEEIFISDATDYLTPGTIHCYSPTGVLLWSATTGDIPAVLAFSKVELQDITVEADTTTNPLDSLYISEVLDYRPAPGINVGKLPIYSQGDSQESMNKKALESLRSSDLVTLGGWGGSITLKLSRTIENKEGLRDFRINGNAFSGSSEPGIILVSKDENNNSLADDTWYEVIGSEHQNATLDTTLVYSSTGYYFPAWINEDLSITGTMLPNNSTQTNGIYVLDQYEYGYADNAPNTSDDSAIDISWANKGLSGIDFIKIYTGVNAKNGELGECSTEISGIDDLHYLGVTIEN